jgi:hypothetical protein
MAAEQADGSKVGWRWRKQNMFLLVYLSIFSLFILTCVASVYGVDDVSETLRLPNGVSAMATNGIEDADVLSTEIIIEEEKTKTLELLNQYRTKDGDASLWCPPSWF